jgi:hypothetical protein
LRVKIPAHKGFAAHHGSVAQNTCYRTLVGVPPGAKVHWGANNRYGKSNPPSAYANFQFTDEESKRSLEMQSSSYRLKENEVGYLEPVSAWESPRFQRFCAITVLSALLFSGIAISNLNADVKSVTDQKVPYIENRVADLPHATYM